MLRQNYSLTYRKVMGVLSVCTLGLILVAGLWPFHAPRNEVSWLDTEDGLRFGHHGSILSANSFHPKISNDDSSGSLEIWLEPALSRGRRTILVCEDSRSTGASFSLEQSGERLIVHRRNIDGNHTIRTAEFLISGALQTKKRVFVTVTLGPLDTSVYLNGVHAGNSQLLGEPTSNFAGRIVMGNSLSASDSWSGKISGLAIYKQRLSSTRVSEHYQDWIKNHQPMLTRDDQPAALYLFNEREGNVVHNQLSSARDLTIPTQYFVLQPAFLSLPWRHYHPTWSYWGDVGINIVGFIPFGFFLVAYLSTLRVPVNPATTTVVLGFLTSLTIEVLQAYLPTRDSGMNDLMTNTIGTAIGVLLYQSPLIEIFAARARLLKGNSRPVARGSIEVRTPV